MTSGKEYRSKMRGFLWIPLKLDEDRDEVTYDMLFVDDAFLSFIVPTLQRGNAVPDAPASASFLALYRFMKCGVSALQGLFFKAVG